jgi:hypothetical protein
MNALEIIRELQADDVLCEELRAVLFTKELLDLPQEVAKFVESTNKRFESLESDASTLKSDVSTLKRDVCVLKGGYYENQWRENAAGYLGNHGFRRIKYIDKAQLSDLCDSIDNQDIRSDILLIDGVHVAQKDSTTVYIFAEVASRIHIDDVERAIRRALKFKEYTGNDAVSCVAGGSIDYYALGTAEESGVIVITPNGWKEDGN